MPGGSMLQGFFPVQRRVDDRQAAAAALFGCFLYDLSPA